MEKTDICIIGGGIIGLAHAYESWKHGYSVRLIEKDAFAVGASIRNFGLVWPIGQPPGDLYDRAMKSRETWIELSKKAGFWGLESGSLHIAYAQDELDVMLEYHEKYGKSTALLSPKDTLERSPSVNPNGLLGALWSETEVNINPKMAVHAISEWLSTQTGVLIQHGEKALHVSSGMVESSKSIHYADKILVCTGSDFQSLFPDTFASSPLIKSKLQMLRTRSQPPEFKLGPVLCGGLTLRHYGSFAQCESLQPYKERISREYPEFDKWGIHVMVSQNEDNEMIIGDSHEYGFTFDPFDKSEINDLILNYMKNFVSIPDLKMLETWHGVYAKNPEGTEFVTEPADGVKVITGFGGAGMTFSFGYAFEEISGW
ncbi:MAG: TIGR03364 family FAD-dependent oxidoreductase [Cyanothece sp. SIO1E1]|nr:TIGR03364 family FAD-dependent oxidoreductase [Cyanothece sp. SIO1E1]